MATPGLVDDEIIFDDREPTGWRPRTMAEDSRESPAERLRTLVNSPRGSSTAAAQIFEPTDSTAAAWAE